MLQLRYTLAIAIIALAAAVMTVSAHPQGGKARIINIDMITQDEGPVETPEDKNRKAELSKLYQQIDGAKANLKVYLKQESNGQPVDQQGKNAALDSLKQLSDNLVEAMYPEMETTEKASTKKNVFEDLKGQCTCEASAELQGIAPMCKKTTQEKVQDALSH